METSKYCWKCWLNSILAKKMPRIYNCCKYYCRFCNLPYNKIAYFLTRIYTKPANKCSVEWWNFCSGSRTMKLQVYKSIMIIFITKINYHDFYTKTGELLLINDEMNNVFAKYDRYWQNRSSSSSKLNAQEQQESLIDFNGYWFLIDYHDFYYNWYLYCLVTIKMATRWMWDLVRQLNKKDRVFRYILYIVLL